MPGPVDDYFKSIKKSNPEYSDEAAWATAWSIYCKHVNPGSDHCHKQPSEYLTKQAARVASRWFEARYAAIRLAMSRDQAKEVLGFPPHKNPTPEEIKSSWKARAFRHHPDRGGSTEKMVQLNVAKDILEGKGRATWEPRKDPQPAKPAKPTYTPPTPDSVIEGQDFGGAWADSGVPADTEWKFVSVPVGMRIRDREPYYLLWILYGQASGRHVFLALRKREALTTTTSGSDNTVTQYDLDWQSSALMYPLSTDLVKLAPRAIKQIANGWAIATKFKTPTRYYPWEAGRPTETLIEKVRFAGGVSLKTILLNTGVLGETSAADLGMKTTVEIITKSNPEREARMRAQKNGMANMADTLDFWIRVGGRKYGLSDASIQQFERVVIPYILGWDLLRDGYTKNLTKMKGSRSRMGLKPDAGTAIQLTMEGLDAGEDPGLRRALQEVLDQYTPEE